MINFALKKDMKHFLLQNFKFKYVKLTFLSRVIDKYYIFIYYPSVLSRII